MFKILDRYIIRKFLGTYVFSIVLLLAIVVMFDVNEKLDSFIKAPLKATIFDYFLNFLPYFANQFSPLFTFIAVIFFTSKLAGNSEIIAMLSTGMSFKRLLRPYMVSAAIIAALTFVLSAYVIPPANVKRINYQNTYVKNKRVDYGQNIMLMVSPGQIAYMNRYDNLSKPATVSRSTSLTKTRNSPHASQHRLSNGTHSTSGPCTTTWCATSTTTAKSSTKAADATQVLHSSLATSSSVQTTRNR